MEIRKKTISIISADKDFRARLKMYLKGAFFSSFPPTDQLLFDYIQSHKIDYYLIDHPNCCVELSDLYNFLKEHSADSKLLFVVRDEQHKELCTKKRSLKNLLIQKEKFEEHLQQGHLYKDEIRHYILNKK